MSANDVEKLCAEIQTIIKGRPIDTVLTALLVLVGFSMRQGALTLYQAQKIIEEIHTNSQIVMEGDISVH